MHVVELKLFIPKLTILTWIYVHFEQRSTVKRQAYCGISIVHMQSLVHT